MAVEYTMRNEWAGSEVDLGAPHWCIRLENVIGFGGGWGIVLASTMAQLNARSQAESAELCGIMIHDSAFSNCLLWRPSSIEEVVMLHYEDCFCQYNQWI